MLAAVMSRAHISVTARLHRLSARMQSSVVDYSGTTSLVTVMPPQASHESKHILIVFVSLVSLPVSIIALFVLAGGVIVEHSDNFLRGTAPR